MRGSLDDLKVKWLAASASDSAVYFFEADDTEDVSQRFAINVQLEKDGEGYRLPTGECIHLNRELAAFSARMLESEERQGGRSVDGFQEECSLCKELQGEEDEQVLCNTCNQGFHLECLVKENVSFPDDVLEDGVEWDCQMCSTKNEEITASSYVRERLVPARENPGMMSRGGRLIRPPARLVS